MTAYAAPSYLSSKPKPCVCSICWAWRVILVTWCANAHCSHLWALQKACRALYTLHLHIAKPACHMQMLIQLVNIATFHLNLVLQQICPQFHPVQCKYVLKGSQPMRLRSFCLRVRASTVRMCVSECASGWVINERSWMASVGHDSTTARKSFLLSPWTADSELTGIFADCWNLIIGVLP